jgi:tripartite-type tricarboxylate transporter receptor subunit TctC
MKLSGILIAAAVGALFTPSFAAAEYPEQAITMIVPFPPGGASDNTARIISAKLEETLGQPVVVENRPGANGAIGADFVARAEPDGYTLMTASIGTFAINAALRDDLPYDPLELDLLTQAVRTPNVLVTRTDFPAEDLGSFIEYLKQNPDGVTFASSGPGSSDHLTAELFWQKSGTTGIHIPYKGGAPAITDLLGGNVDASFQNYGSVAKQLEAGGMKVLAAATEERIPQLPDTPTLAEAGIPDVVVYSWQAVAGPNGMPAEVTTKLEMALQDVLSQPDVRESLEALGFEVVGNSSEEFRTIVEQEIARWSEVVKAGNITVE